MAIILYPTAGLLLWAMLAHIDPKYDSFKNIVMTMSATVIFLCLMEVFARL